MDTWLVPEAQSDHPLRQRCRNYGDQSVAAHYYCSTCHHYDFDDPVIKENAGTSACDLPDKICPNCGTVMNKEGHDIPFETFLGFKGDKEPDIDLNFSNEYQSNAHDYTEVIFGAGQTFRAERLVQWQKRPHMATLRNIVKNMRSQSAVRKWNVLRKAV